MPHLATKNNDSTDLSIGTRFIILGSVSYGASGKSGKGGGVFRAGAVTKSSQGNWKSGAIRFDPLQTLGAEIGRAV